MSPTEARSTMTANSVDLIDEYDARCVLLTLFEQIANAACTDTNKHLHKIGARNREERHIGFARDRARQQRLTGARRPNQEHPFRDTSAQLLEFLRLTKKLNDLL